MAFISLSSSSMSRRVLRCVDDLDGGAFSVVLGMP